MTRCTHVVGTISGMSRSLTYPVSIVNLVIEISHKLFVEVTDYQNILLICKADLCVMAY